MYFTVIPHLLDIFFTSVACGYLNSTQFFLNIREKWDFPGGLVVKTPHFQCRGNGFHPWWKNQDHTCHMAWPKKKNNSRKNSTQQNYTVKSALTQLLPVDVNYRTTGSIWNTHTLQVYGCKCQLLQLLRNANNENSSKSYHNSHSWQEGSVSDYSKLIAAPKAL